MTDSLVRRGNPDRYPQREDQGKTAGEKMVTDKQERPHKKPTWLMSTP